MYKLNVSKEFKKAPFKMSNQPAPIYNECGFLAVVLAGVTMMFFLFH